MVEEFHFNFCTWRSLGDQSDRFQFLHISRSQRRDARLVFNFCEIVRSPCINSTTPNLRYFFSEKFTSSRSSMKFTKDYEQFTKGAIIVQKFHDSWLSAFDYAEIDGSMI